MQATANPRAIHPPERFHALDRAEQLVLWTLRAIALGHAECPVLRRTFHAALGSAAEEAFLALFVTVRSLGQLGRRRLRVHIPGCDGVSADEQDLLALIAAAQHALSDGDETDVRRRLDGLLEGGQTEGFLMVLQAAAGALEVGGYRLPLRDGREVALAAGPRRLH